MEAVYPAGASALSRGRRRRAAPRARRTTPVTFAEIKEVDEESEEACGGDAVPAAGAGAGAGAGALERRRRDELAEPLGAQFAEFRRRRARRDVLREPAEEPPCPPRAASEPRPAPPAPPALALAATSHGAGAGASAAS